MDDKNQAISDDQELANVLQGVQQQARTMATHDPAARSQDDPALQYEEIPTPAAVSNPSPATPSAAAAPATSPTAPEPTTNPEPAPTTPSASTPVPSNTALEGLKKEALEELRPLVTKLDLPAKEKFDTMLLIIRSTDDQELLAPAHEAAKTIEDETERAEALLDIVKEIDYFASQAQK